MRRQRPINSCEACRNRRIRCDKIRPTCGRCSAAKTRCSYKSPPRESRDEIQGGQSFEPPGTTKTQTALDDSSRADTSSQHLQHEGRLVAEGSGRSTYFGPTFWANTLSPNFYADTNAADARPFAGLAMTVDDYNANNPKIGQFSRNVPRSAYGSTPVCKRCGRRYGLQCVLQLLPKRTVCERLVDLFFSTVYTLTPILHLPTFATDHEDFWQSGGHQYCNQAVAGSFLETRPTFIALYFSILFAALKSSSQSWVQEILGDDMVEAGDLYFAATVSTSLTGFPRRPSLYNLAGFIFLQSQLMREEEFADTPGFIGTAYRVALSMGLHRDPQGYDFSQSQAEMRRRLWWHIIHLDVMASTSSGLSPLFIDELMSNTALMSEYEDFGVIKCNSSIDVRCLVANCRYRCTREMRCIIRRHFDNAFRSDIQLKEVLRQLDELGSNVHGVIKSLLVSESRNAPGAGETALGDLTDKELRSVPTAIDQVWSMNAEKRAPAVTAFRSWAAILLHLMLHKAYIVFYHPLFKSSDKSVHVDIRASAVRHSQVFLHLFLRLCKHRACNTFGWMYPGTYQPLQALSIMLADLMEDPHSDRASESRGLIDATFELYEVDEGIVDHYNNNSRRLTPYGREAWSLLLRTRRKALEQVGKDSHVLLPNTTLAADTCVCGEESTLNDDLMRAHAMADSVSPVGPDDVTESLPALFGTGEIDVPGMDNPGFDWDEWDLQQGSTFGVLA